MYNFTTVVQNRYRPICKWLAWPSLGPFKKFRVTVGHNSDDNPRRGGAGVPRHLLLTGSFSSARFLSSMTLTTLFSEIISHVDHTVFLQLTQNIKGTPGWDNQQSLDVASLQAAWPDPHGEQEEIKPDTRNQGLRRERLGTRDPMRAA